MAGMNAPLRTGLPFLKMHGLGNAFVILAARAAPLALGPAQAAAVADRRTGVGCDQLILIRPAEHGQADAFMEIRNADGGEVSACGNATRCVADLLMRQGGKRRVVIQTRAGLLEAEAAADGLVAVDMGPARLDWRDIPVAEAVDTLHMGIGAGILQDPVGVNMGNPHAVFFVEDAEAVDLARLGPQIETHPFFPERVNVEAAQIVSPERIRMRVWERGSGITRACGTGACATLVAAARRGLTGRKAEVVLDGGSLVIEWLANDHVRMIGPVATAFSGTLDVLAGMSDAPDIVTFGCRLNTYESEVMRGHARAAGLTDVVIVNTCAVTNEAERQARQTIRKLRRERPGARIIVTGCAAQVNPQMFAAMPEVDQVVGNAEKMRPETYLAPSHERIVVDDVMKLREVAEHLVSGFEGRARAFVEVQQGCDHRCTFCIIPFGRGPNRSVPIGRIVEQVRALAAADFGEVVFTGVDITAYGGDLPGQPSLGQMMRRVLAQVPELPRLRLSSLDPVEVDDDLLHLVAEESRLMPHFHLSIQAGDDMILKRMKRRHLRADVVALAERLRTLRPDLALGADIIAGFPTETDEMFARSLDIVDECGLTHLHVFPYSARPGTPAARMPQLPGDIVKERAARLRAKGRTAMAGFLASRVGGTASVLVEQDATGHCEHYLPVRLDTAPPPGSIVAARITGIEGEALIGEIRA